MQLRKILVSAGEASGDLYASLVVDELRRLHPRTPISSAAPGRACGPPACARWWMPPAWRWSACWKWWPHIPRIFGEYRKLLAAARAEKRPDLAILTDSPDFHLRVARRLQPQGVPVVYLVAPQVWAWRKGRLRSDAPHLRACCASFPLKRSFSGARGARHLHRPSLWPGWSRRRSRGTSFFGNTGWLRAVH